MKKQKDPMAVALGRRGGLKGGKARAESMTAAERSAAARKAVMARWHKKTPKTPKLSKSDWMEIYYALDFKMNHSPAVVGDQRWKRHLKRIIAAIGPDGEIAAASRTSFVFAELDTRSFSFTIFARDTEHAQELMKKAWAKHCRETGADPDFLIGVDLNHYEIDTTKGTVWRDYEPLITENL